MVEGVAGAVGVAEVEDAGEVDGGVSVEAKSFINNKRKEKEKKKKKRTDDEWCMCVCMMGKTAEIQNS